MRRDLAIIAAVVLLSIGSIPLLIHSDEGPRSRAKRAIGGIAFAAALALLVYWVALF